MAGRQPVRLLARQLRSQPSPSHSPLCPRRTFSSVPARLAAQNFTMPAMSPTMTEGNISSWNVKEGDSFSTGDVLLEIETDKASMDVEAQDDGVMVKIFSPEGSKAIKVGTRIAILAEPGDDVSSIDIPADDSKPIESAADNIKGGKDASYESSGVEKEVKGTPQNPRPSKDKTKPKSGPQGPGQNPKYPLYPSVIALVHSNHLSDSDVAKIPATGPANRLLKGDVLAYLGHIAADYSANASKSIEHRSHLDLSDIKLLKQDPKTTQPPPHSTPIPTQTSIALPISLSAVLAVQKRLHDTLNITLPLSTFLSRAVDIANDDLPQPLSAKASQDELFNAILGLSAIPTTSRGTYLPQIDALPSTSMATRTPSASTRVVGAKKPDIIDILSGKARSTSPSTSRRSGGDGGGGSDLLSPVGGSITTSGGALNVFSVTVPVGEEKRARTFLERMKTVLQSEPGRLVL